jgi:ketosteroid isomerase-like protein
MEEHNVSQTKLTEESIETRTSQAFKAFRRAFEEGQATNFLSLVTKDFHFFIPLPLEHWKVEQRGKQRFEELVRFEREVLLVQFTPLIELEDAKYGIVVFRAEGTLNNLPYSNELTVVFEFENDQIRSFREYVGMPLMNYEG